MLELLKSLYPDNAKDIHARLKELIADFKGCATGKTIKEFCEKDIFLLCYPDNVQSGNEKTLKTLGKFLKRYCKDFNIVHILPFYPASGDDGFAVIDYRLVDEKFGTWNDIRKLSNKYSLMFDVVLNHVSDKSEWFKGFLSGEERYKRFFISYDKEIDTSGVFRPRDKKLLQPYDTSWGRRFVWSTFPFGQVDLNYSNPEVLIEIAAIILDYIKKGAAHLRFDAIAYIYKETGTSCFGNEESYTILKILKKVIKKASPDVKIIIEAVIEQEKNLEYIKAGTDLAYNFPIEGLLYFTFLKGDARKLLDFADSMKEGLLNLCISHDGIHLGPVRRILTNKERRMLSDDAGSKGCRPIKSKDTYELNITFTDAIGSAKAYIASQAIVLSLKGVPLIYLNNLIGARNWIEGMKQTGMARTVNRRKFDFDKICEELEDDDSEKHKIYRDYIRLIKVRKNEPAFSPHAELEAVDMDRRIFSIMRSRKLLVLVNTSDEEVVADVSDIVGSPARDIITGTDMNMKELMLKPYGVLWLKKKSPRRRT